MLVLSLFPGIGLLDMAFEAEGFCVVRGPDLLWGGDVRRFHPPAGRFDGVIGGPPCQAFSSLANIVRARGHRVAPNLIPEFERCVAEAWPTWFLMENVPAAPEPKAEGFFVRSVLVNAREHCGAEQDRTRRFSFGTQEGQDLVLDWWRPPVAAAWSPTVVGAGAFPKVLVGGNGTPRRDANGKLQRKYPRATSSTAYAEALRLQGLPADFDLPGFTVEAKCQAVGNGVPLPMGRAVARAVRRALGLPLVTP